MKKLTTKNRKLVVQFVEYMISGGAYFWVGYGAFFCFYSILGWNLWWSTITSNVIGWTVNYILQRYWVFNNKKLKGHQTQVTGRYIFITLVDFIMNYFILYGLKQVGISPYIGQFISSAFFTVWNYLWYRFWVFPGIDDFGIVAVEAMAAGTPIIAFNGGGALDFVLAGKTGLFFAEQSAGDLAEVLEKFDSKKFDNVFIANYAENFSSQNFEKRFKTFLAELK